MKFDNTTNDVQLLLRAFIEEFIATVDSSSPATSKTKSSNHFIPVAQWLNSEFQKQKPKRRRNFFKRLQEILGAESVEYDNKVLVELINKHFPDWRRVLNECQRYSAGGKIDSGILATFSDVKVNDLVKNLRKRIFPKYVNGLSITWTMILLFYCVVFTMLVHDSMVPNSIPAAVLTLAKYQYQMAFVADQEINMLACLTELMVECEFK